MDTSFLKMVDNFDEMSDEEKMEFLLKVIASLTDINHKLIEFVTENLRADTQLALTTQIGLDVFLKSLDRLSSKLSKNPDYTGFLTFLED